MCINSLVENSGSSQNMAFIIRLSSCLVLLFVAFSPAAGKGDTGGDLIESTCSDTNYYELCVTTFLSDPKSLKVPYKDLGPIMAKLVLANATSIRSYIEQRMDEEKESQMKKVLKKCYKNYSTIISNLKSVMGEFKDLNFQPIVGAMRSAQKKAVACEGEFKKEGLKSPVSKRNELMAKLADNGFVIMSDMMV